jgi:hypothetical protein
VILSNYVLHTVSEDSRHLCSISLDGTVNLIGAAKVFPRMEGRGQPKNVAYKFMLKTFNVIFSVRPRIFRIEE